MFWSSFTSKGNPVVSTSSKLSNKPSLSVSLLDVDTIKPASSLSFFESLSESVSKWSNLKSPSVSTGDKPELLALSYISAKPSPSVSAFGGL